MAPPSLVDLCAKKWKDMEGSTKGRDLSPMTDKHRETFYEKRFGTTGGVIEEMRGNKVAFKWKQAYEYKEVEIKARGMMRRLVLEEDEYDYCGAGNNGSSSSTWEERDSPKSGAEDEEEANEEADIEDFLESGVGGRVYIKEDDEETDIEEFIERVVEIVSDEEEDEESDVEEEEVEEEEQTQIEEVEDDRDGSEVWQEEDGCGDHCDDGSYGNYYSDDGSYGDDYDGDGDDDYDEYY